MEQVRIVQFGCGKASKYTMRYALASGCKIVAAIDNDERIIGTDIGLLMNIDEQGVVVQDAANAEQILKQLKPDICILTTMSLLKDIEAELIMMANLGINVVTSCEEAFYPWNSSPEIAEKIDAIAKKNDCTISGTGYQDMSWCNLVATLAGSCNKIDSIKITTSFNLDNYGIAPALIHGAGMAVDAFPADFASADIGEFDLDVGDNEIMEFVPSFPWNSNGWLCDRMGLTVKKQTQRCIPQTYDTTLSSKSLGMDILAGYVVGMTAIAITETEEGPTIITESIGKVYTSEENDINICEIIGSPNINCELEKPENVGMACASIVGRIPDVINAPAGFIATSRMPVLAYRSKSLEQYIK